LEVKIEELKKSQKGDFIMCLVFSVWFQLLIAKYGMLPVSLLDQSTIQPIN